MESQMKLTIPAILVTALIAGSPTAFAQGMNYSGSSSNPATATSKDETTGMTKQSKKRMAMASHKKKHHVKKSKSETTGSGSSSPKKY